MFLSVHLRCVYGRYYTGQIGNLEKRFGQVLGRRVRGLHRPRRPVSHAWSQECVTREDVWSAEMQIKGRSH